MSNPISFDKASSSHHSSGGFGIEVSPEPEINAHPLRRNAAENTKPPERTITVRTCGGEIRDARTKRPFISAFVEACPPRTLVSWYLRFSHECLEPISQIENECAKLWQAAGKARRKSIANALCD